MLEPRGHADMYGAVITEPVLPDSDCGVLFLHNEGYSTMCGHGIIALATAAVEQHLFEIADPGAIKIDTPAGLIEAATTSRDGKVETVSFLNVPSFVQQQINGVEYSRGAVDMTVAYGGAYYAYVDAEEVGVELVISNAAELVALGTELKLAANERINICHPDGGDDLNFLYGVIFVQYGQAPGHSRNVCVFADGELDRSPTGTGVSGRAAIHHAAGDCGPGDELIIESILGTSFSVKCVAETRVGDVPAVITRVTGSAYMTGEHRFSMDRADPLKQGFFIR
jgi:trans-L-3-hydroxyproline dehydratase